MGDSRIGRGCCRIWATAILASSALLLSSCDTTAPNQPSVKRSLAPQELNASIGWVHGACLAIRNQDLKPETAVQIVLLENPQSIIRAKVAAVARSQNECVALRSDRAEGNQQDGRAFYSLAAEKSLQDIVAIAVVSGKVRLSPATAEMDLDENGIAERARSCSTHEGVQFFISTTPKFDHTSLWSDYYYLGYDQTATCP